MYLERTFFVIKHIWKYYLTEIHYKNRAYAEIKMIVGILTTIKSQPRILFKKLKMPHKSVS